MPKAEELARRVPTSCQPKSKNLAVCFRGPLETPLDILLSSASSSDGAAAVVVGGDPDTATSMAYYLYPNVPSTVAKGAAACSEETFSTRYGIKDWNSLFYSVHPGGPGVLNKFEQ
ncbi:hypothetical protein NC653_009748 [Populus alba x Populus x berolinensis]|uniref:Chalcone/stilbene synthase C-terminal domain-containing protein n=1 Tax=Populus alba x Populus x berolinensis TaxID=444605 RepID=A0AAD6R9V0_9ROSI|nr:hypothetical protein NC653_009707 [Populus alba x Populus x berolinensis]KAJ7005025.1 hypothetical protein NC653_009748 [Populus alba x Populus x berolinensis]